jgi:hypothetical protein
MKREKADEPLFLVASQAKLLDFKIYKDMNSQNNTYLFFFLLFEWSESIHLLFV